MNQIRTTILIISTWARIQQGINWKAGTFEDQLSQPSP